MFDSVRRFAGSIFGRSDPGPKEGDRPRSARPSQRQARTLMAPELRRGAPGGRPRPRRPRAEIEADMDRLGKKQKDLQRSLERERAFAAQSGGRSNQGLVDAVRRRADKVRGKMDSLAAELAATHERIVPPARAARHVEPRREPSRGEERGSDRTLAQAAKVALRKARFPSASERAVFEKLVADLADGSAEIQLHVLERLGELKSLAGLPVFAAAVRHPSEEVRIAALRGVLAMRDPSTREIIITAMRDRSHRVRVWGVRGLYGLNDPALPEILCGQLGDPHPYVRRAALTYLGWKRARVAERAVARTLRDQSAEVRVAAAHALEHCGGNGSVFRLIHALKDDEEEVREAAAAALERCLGSSPSFDAKADASERLERIDELKKFWRRERVRRIIADPTLPTDDAGADADDVSDLEPSALAADVDASPSLEPDADGDKASDTAAVEDGFGDEIPTEASAEIGEEASELDGDSDDGGLDAIPDIGGDLDSVDDSFVTDDSAEESSV